MMTMETLSKRGFEKKALQKNTVQIRLFKWDF